VAFLNDPTNFVTLQTRLGSVDRLNEYTRHIGSALFETRSSREKWPFPDVGKGHFARLSFAEL
jgi:deferrochelatase/peroxidase EfeB